VNPHDSDFEMAPAELLDGKLVDLRPDAVTIVRNGQLLDGVGGRMADATVVIRGSRIEAIHQGKASIDDVPAHTREVDAGGGTIMPGLFDAHIHFMGEQYVDPLRVHLAPSEGVKFLRAAFELYQTLASGVTTVRALGHGPAEHAYALRAAMKEGLLIGPRLLTSGWALSQTRGHGDVPQLPYEWVEHARPRSMFCDGEIECRRAVRRNFGEGADVIKVYSSENRSGAPNFTVAELSVITDEAHRRGKRVATHAKTYEGVRNALLAGVDTIEHGTPAIHDDLLEMMYEQRSFLVPTMATVHRVAYEGGDWEVSPAAMDQAKRELEGRQRMVRAAHERGVQIATGSDAGARAGFGLLSTRELELLVDVGLTPMEAISAATSVSAAALGLSDDVGSLKAGKLADIVVIDGNPLEDIRILQDRSRVRFVLQGHGQLTN
jgi:imidazolonepropionase-like amidohydrolase